MKNLNNVNVEAVEVVGAVEVVETVGAVEVKTKKPSLRQDFIKGFKAIREQKELVMEATKLTSKEFDKMVEYFETQIDKNSKKSKTDKYVPSDKGETILDILLAYEGIYKTGKEIAENSKGLLKANGVSGAIRGLINANYVEATQDTPKKYTITQLGVDYMNK